jgi:hypothetical protein
MADYFKDLNKLKMFYVSQETLMDKDILKNETWETYNHRVFGLFAIPFGAQIYQLTQINQPEKAAMFHRIRVFKWLTFSAAILLAYKEKTDLEKKWLYFDRYYPEATQLQKNLE